ncbi:hypothetical protein FB451DRAFT_1361708 [Mycena latifolia]|nr:hypothetical protein FB451DRAFT_1361708 [Mycena latifolia]
MENLFSQVLSLVSVLLIPFVVNDIMRYIALVLASLITASYLVCYNSPTCRIVRLDASLKEVGTLLTTAANEFPRDPRFKWEGVLAWELDELKNTVSALHTSAINMKYVAWKEYAHDLLQLSLSLSECRREIADLQASTLIALESARQQKLEEDFNDRMAALIGTFPGWSGGGGQIPLRMRASRMNRPASDALYLRLTDIDSV